MVINEGDILLWEEKNTKIYLTFIWVGEKKAGLGIFAQQHKAAISVVLFYLEVQALAFKMTTAIVRFCCIQYMKIYTLSYFIKLPTLHLVFIHFL